MSESIRLPAGAAEHLDMPEGTLKLGYVLPAALDEPPEERITLIQDESPAGTSMRIEIDEDLRLHLVRQAPGGAPADVDVGIAPLRGATRLDLFCVWSPLEMRIHVFDKDQPNKTVSRSIGVSS